MAIEASPPRPDVNRSQFVVDVVISLCALSCGVVALRVYVRTYMTRQKLGWDDVFMIAGALFTIVETILICESTRFGLGRHIEYIQPDKPWINIGPFLKLAYAAILVYVTQIFLIKSSLILFYHRLSPSAYFHRLCWGYLIFNTMLWITFMMCGIFSCSPVHFFWDHSIRDGKCIKLEQVYLANASLSVIMDIVALLIPLPAIWKLNMSRRHKLQLCGLFAFGFFVCIASFIRMTTIFNFKLNSETDPTWFMVKSHIWSAVEVNIGIITVCTPVVTPFFSRYIWPFFSRRHPTNHNNPHSNSHSTPQQYGHHHKNSNSERSKGLGLKGVGGKGGKQCPSLSTQQFIEHEMHGYGNEEILKSEAASTVEQFRSGDVRKDSESASGVSVVMDGRMGDVERGEAEMGRTESQSMTNLHGGAG